MLEVVRSFFTSFSKTRGEAALGSEPQLGFGLGLGLGLGWVDALSRFDKNKTPKTPKIALKTTKWNTFGTLSGTICGTKPVKASHVLFYNSSPAKSGSP